LRVDLATFQDPSSQLVLKAVVTASRMSSETCNTGDDGAGGVDAAFEVGAAVDAVCDGVVAPAGVVAAAGMVAVAGVAVAGGMVGAGGVVAAGGEMVAAAEDVDVGVVDVPPCRHKYTHPEKRVTV
jgi:hypothetical protein